MTWTQNWGSMGWINLRSSGTSRHIYIYQHTKSSYYYSDRCADDLETKLGKHGLDQPSVKWHITAYIYISAYSKYL